jgi:hypothetical protein
MFGERCLLVSFDKLSFCLKIAWRDLILDLSLNIKSQVFKPKVTQIESC